MIAEQMTSRRADGRSHQEVLVALVAGGEPDRVYTYEELAEALAADVDRSFSRQDVQQVVRLAKPQLLRLHRRTMTNVPNVGYRIARAADHQSIAQAHTRRGQRQMRHALLTMENARLEEMTAGERKLHLAQLTINQRLYQEQRRILSKQNRHEELIAQLVDRVEQLEAKKA